MKAANVFQVILGLGIALFLAAFFWAKIDTGSSQWGEEQSQAYSQASNRLHALFEERPTKDRPRSQIRSEVEQLREEVSKMKYELELAQNSGESRAIIMRWAGVAITIVGLVGYLVTREAD